MFEDFNQQKTHEGRGRRGVSALLSIGVFGGLALVVGGAVTAHQVHRQRLEREQEVTFADLPAVQAPKPKTLTKPKAAKKTAIKRQPIVDLKAIPTARPDEAEGELVAAVDTGAVEGIIEKKALPPLPPPPPPVKNEVVPPSAEQERETIAAPRFVSGCRAPEVPSALMANAATVRIEVEMMIDETGKVVSSRIVQSSPAIPDELVLSCANQQVFAPAHLPDGTAIPYPFRRRFIFKPAQA
jgi:hypothetical protein